MFVRTFVLVALAVAMVAGPAGAAPAPQITDECGDAGSRGEWNDDSMAFEENRPHLDIKSGGVTGVYGADGQFQGFKTSITTCGAVSSSQGTYNIGWGYGGDCYGHVAWTLAGHHNPDGTGVEGHAKLSDVAQAVVTEECYRPATGPTAQVIGTEVETVYRVELPAEAVTFSGDTVTFNVATAALPAAAQKRFVAGTKWAHVGVVTMEQGAALWGGYGDTDGNTGRLYVRTDFALGNNSYTVGEDAS